MKVFLHIIFLLSVNTDHCSQDLPEVGEIILIQPSEGLANIKDTIKEGSRGVIVTNLSGMKYLCLIYNDQYFEYNLKGYTFQIDKRPAKTNVFKVFLSDGEFRSKLHTIEIVSRDRPFLKFVPSVIKVGQKYTIHGTGFTPDIEIEIGNKRFRPSKVKPNTIEFVPPKGISSGKFIVVSPHGRSNAVDVIAFKYVKIDISVPGLSDKKFYVGVELFEDVKNYFSIKSGEKILVPEGDFVAIDVLNADGLVGGAVVPPEEDYVNITPKTTAGYILFKKSNDVKEKRWEIYNNPPTDFVEQIKKSSKINF